MECNKDGECHCTNFNRKYCKHYGTPRKKRSGTKYSSITPKKKEPTGELAKFIEIWTDRTHESWLDGTRIELFDVRCFAHVLPKGGYGHYRLNEENIVLLTPEQHNDQHSKGKEQLILEYARWQRFFEYQDTLREEYNNKYQ